MKKNLQFARAGRKLLSPEVWGGDRRIGPVIVMDLVLVGMYRQSDCHQSFLLHHWRHGGRFLALLASLWPVAFRWARQCTIC
jgi:hypothetical protein